MSAVATKEQPLWFLDPRRLTEIAASYGIEILGPPGTLPTA